MFDWYVRTDEITELIAGLIYVFEAEKLEVKPGLTRVRCETRDERRSLQELHSEFSGRPLDDALFQRAAPLPRDRQSLDVLDGRWRHRRRPAARTCRARGACRRRLSGFAGHDAPSTTADSQCNLAR